MPSGVVVVFAVVGVLTGLSVRPIVFALSVPTGNPTRAQCLHCHAPVLAVGRFTVPAVVSGRCRSCRTRIAVPVGVIEVLLGMVFTLLACRHPDVMEAVALCWLATHGATIALIDIAVHRIPNILAVSAYVGVTFLLAATALAEHHPVGLLRAVLAGMGLAGFYAVLALASRGGLGMGDVKLAGSLGTALGWLGLPALTAGTLLGFALGATYGLLVITIGRLRWRQQFAFGPFMVLGAIVALLM